MKNIGKFIMALLFGSLMACSSGTNLTFDDIDSMLLNKEGIIGGFEIGDDKNSIFEKEYPLWQKDEENTLLYAAEPGEDIRFMLLDFTFDDTQKVSELHFTMNAKDEYLEYAEILHNNLKKEFNSKFQKNGEDWDYFDTNDQGFLLSLTLEEMGPDKKYLSVHCFK
ncbi:MAG: hypothetical protein ACWA41_02100 [Putridiphycobacter sp.]